MGCSSAGIWPEELCSFPSFETRSPPFLLRGNTHSCCPGVDEEGRPSVVAQLSRGVAQCCLGLPYLPHLLPGSGGWFPVCWHPWSYSLGQLCWGSALCALSARLLSLSGAAAPISSQECLCDTTVEARRGAMGSGPWAGVGCVCCPRRHLDGL